MGKARDGLLRDRNELIRGTVWKASLRLRSISTLSLKYLVVVMRKHILISLDRALTPFYHTRVMAASLFLH